MKAKDKKAIALIEEKIKALYAREKELEKVWDDLWEIGDRDAYRKAVVDLGDEYDAIDGKISEHRAEIRRIRDADLIARGYEHSMNLARANID